MCRHFLAVLLHPRHLSLPYFVAGIKLSLYFWPSEVSPDDLAVSFQFFFPLWVSLARLVETGCKFDSWSGQSRLQRAFCHPCPSSELLSICLHPSLLGWVLTTLLSWNVWLEALFQWELGIRLNSFLFWMDTFLNWSLHFFVRSIFALPHTFTANYSVMHIRLCGFSTKSPIDTSHTWPLEQRS